MFDLENTSGEFTRQPDSTHVVSLWYIPGGVNYTDAKAMNVFFSKAEEAAEFARKWSMPPEMAMVITIETYDATQAMLAKQPWNKVLMQPIAA